MKEILTQRLKKLRFELEQVELLRYAVLMEIEAIESHLFLNPPKLIKPKRMSRLQYQQQNQKKSA